MRVAVEHSLGDVKISFELAKSSFVAVQVRACLIALTTKLKVVEEAGFTQDSRGCPHRNNEVRMSARIVENLTKLLNGKGKEL